MLVTSVETLLEFLPPQCWFTNSPFANKCESQREEKYAQKKVEKVGWKAWPEKSSVFIHCFQRNVVSKMATHSSTFTITLVIPLSILCTSFNGYLEHQVRSTSNCCEQCSEHSAPVVEVIKKGLRRTEHKQLCHTEMRFLHYLFLSTNENLREANTKC